mgnify:CR=1 FL=1
MKDPADKKTKRIKELVKTSIDTFEQNKANFESFSAVIQKHVDIEREKKQGSIEKTILPCKSQITCLWTGSCYRLPLILYGMNGVGRVSVGIIHTIFAALPGFKKLQCHLFKQSIR